MGITAAIMYRHTCDICGRGYESASNFPLPSLSAHVPHPSMPESWHRVDEQIICDDHALSIVKYERLDNGRMLKREATQWERVEFDPEAPKGTV